MRQTPGKYGRVIDIVAGDNSSCLSGNGRNYRSDRHNSEEKILRPEDPRAESQLPGSGQSRRQIRGAGVNVGRSKNPQKAVMIVSVVGADAYRSSQPINRVRRRVFARVSEQRAGTAAG